MPTRFFDKFLARLDKIDQRQLSAYVKELVSENAFLHSIIDRLDGAVVILDKDARIANLNPEASFLLGVSEKRIQGKLYDRCPIDTQIIRSIKRAVDTKGEYYHNEILISFPKELLLNVLIVPVEEENKISGWLVQLKDITLIKHTNMQRIQTEKLKALVTLAAGIAHELGNPLNSLGIHLQLLYRELKNSIKKNGDVLLKTLGIAQSEVKRMDQIITRFLQAARPLQPRFSISHVHDVIDETLALLNPAIRKNKIKIDKKYNTKIPKIYLDYIQLRQVFINIVKNSIEAMPDRGTLKIATTLAGSRIKIVFKDNGIGIPEDKLEKVFEPYYTTKTNGSGLGLMTVHRVVREHEGELEVQSKIGKGTTFTVYLPIDPRGPKLLPPGRKIKNSSK